MRWRRGPDASWFPAHIGQGRGGLADRRHHPGAFRHHHRPIDPGIRSLPGPDHGAGPAGRHLGASQSSARLAGDRAGMVRDLSVPAAPERVATVRALVGARAVSRQGGHEGRPKGRPYKSPFPTRRFEASEAATTTTATTAIMIVQTALISGFTPRRTSE